ncbi:ferrous iron transport protein A [Arcobacter venerupis]|uniref:Ferrous iron transport protein A n=1 Tax=Arcobacter venerupis TaxID=1054033 RepID=A0AAE7BCL3_9BACT|nr:FeoA family protein [Arcobacter venerupis]QKF67937.1 ferrous iron transport protein A [Arcobacter venerupis]RWS49540.1 iron transporter [Arcobacter venerupis]
MTLNQLNINEKAVITAINCNEILKSRLYSFGISRGVEVQIVELTLSKSTIEIKINQSKIALRLNEASKIEVAYEK